MKKAEKANLTTKRERVELAVNFAREKLTDFREGDWLNLRDDVRQFLASPREDEEAEWNREQLDSIGGFIPGPKQKPETLSVKQLTELQTVVRFVLACHAGKRDRDVVKVLPSSSELRFLHSRETGLLPILGGEPQDLYIAVLCFLMADTAAPKIRECPSCGLPYLRERRMEYCSRTCANRESQKKWRENHAKKK